MEKLRVAMAGRSTHAVSRECGWKVGHQQIANILSGQTPPWRVSVQVAQLLSETLDGLELQDFQQPLEKKAA